MLAQLRRILRKRFGGVWTWASIAVTSMVALVFGFRVPLPGIALTRNPILEVWCGKFCMGKRQRRMVNSLPGRTFTFDFYELTGNILPGTVVLIGIAALFPELEQFHFLLPESIGSVFLFVMLAYIIGHLLQGIGNIFEYAYWKLWRGRPTDWPVTRPRKDDFAGFAWVQKNLPSSSQKDFTKADLDWWRTRIREVQTLIVSAGHCRRLDVFNGNYLLFRGLLAGEAVIGGLWLASTGPELCNFFQVLKACVILVVIVGLTLYRMHHFAVHYARELFAGASLFETKNEEYPEGGPNYV